MALNEEQMQAVIHESGPMMVLAGPGSGKTTVLVERIRHLIEDLKISPGEILVITFSKKAALEMQSRFERLTSNKYYQVTFGTFHAVFYNILKHHYRYSKSCVLSTKEKYEYISDICQRLGINEGMNTVFINEMISNISNYKSLSGEHDIKLKMLMLDKDTETKFVSIYNEYVKAVNQDGKLDFDDMLLKCNQLIKDNKEVLKYWQKIYKYFLVDEFQDINEIQYETLMLLAGENKNVFAVGDDDQSIYSFRGSNPELMRKFIENDDHKNICKTVNLSKNYRCSEQIISLSNLIIKNNRSRINKSQTAEKLDKILGTVNVSTFTTSDDEALYVIKTIKEIKSGKTAILYRTSQCANLIEEKLIMSGISYERRDEKSSFYESDYVLDIIAYLKIADGCFKRKDIYRILNRPYRGLSRENIAESVSKLDLKDLYIDNNGNRDAWDKLIKDIELVREMIPFGAVNYIIKGMGYGKYLKKYYGNKGFKDEMISEYLDELLERSRQFKSISEWLNYIEDLSNNKEDIEANSKKSDFDSDKPVHMMTVHASKGLEFDNVIIVGLREGVFPHKKAITELAVEEERRLMYVAMTRARENLFICGIGASQYGKRVSRFLEELSYKKKEE